MGDSPLQVRDKVSYLGITVDRQLNFVEHTKQARNRLTGMVRNIAVVAGRRWGVGTETRRLVYARVVEPIALYGAEVWGERAHDSRVRRHLAAAQRPFLLGITRAFRTVANSALRVLSGVPPLHIRAEKLYKKRVLTRDQNLNKIEAKKRFDAEELQSWQEEWAEERTGRPTHLVLPKVARGWLGFSERAVQLVTGHGYFGTYYRRFRLRECTGACECGAAEESADHVWWQCELQYRAEARVTFVGAVGGSVSGRDGMRDVPREILVL